MQNLAKIEGIVLLDKNGERILANYNSNGELDTLKKQMVFEKRIEDMLKSLPSEDNLTSFDNHIVLSKTYKDFYMILVADESENELLLEEIMSALEDSIIYFCGKNVKLPVLFRYYTEIVLLFDEILNEGMLITIRSEDLINKVLMKDKWGSKKSGASRRGLFF